MGGPLFTDPARLLGNVGDEWCTRCRTPGPRSVGEAMDTQLKAARHARGWSQLRVLTQLEALGRQRGVAMPTRASLKTELSRWENGHVQPHEPYRSLLVELYATPPDDLGLPDDGLIHVPVPRNGIGPVELSEESVGLMRTLLSQFAAADNDIGAGHLLRLATQHVIRLEPMLLHVRGSLRADGLRLLSEFAELAGWFCQDAGRLDAALHWTDRALDFAEELGDPGRRAYVPELLKHAVESLARLRPVSTVSDWLGPLRVRVYRRPAIHRSAHGERDRPSSASRSDGSSCIRCSRSRPTVATVFSLRRGWCGCARCPGVARLRGRARRCGSR